MIRALAIAAAMALQADAQPPPAVFRSGIEVVELDVSVTRVGLPVQGLTARDFALTDNGVAQAVDSVMLDASRSSSTRARASPAIGSRIWCRQARGW